MTVRFLTRVCLGSLLVVGWFPAFAGDSVAGHLPVNSGGRECAALADGFLAAKLGLWQQRLWLADWKISIVMSTAKELKPKTLGNIHWDATNKTAVIRVLAAAEYPLQCPVMLEDMEFTVVHELIHLELSSLPRSQASRRDEEHAVNQITDALLALERRNDGSSR